MNKIELTEQELYSVMWDIRVRQDVIDKQHLIVLIEDKISEIKAKNNDVLDLVSNAMLNIKCDKCNHVFELKYSDNRSRVDTLQISVGRDADVYDVSVECPKCENNETVY